MKGMDFTQIYYSLKLDHYIFDNKSIDIRKGESNATQWKSSKSKSPTKTQSPIKTKLIAKT